MKKYISWFSCGAASAVATKMALNMFGKDSVRIIYQDTGSEHGDNARFLLDCQEWFGKKIEIVKSEKYKDVDDVIEKTRYIVGPAGARCTGALKREVAESIINFGKDQEIEIIGYTLEEKHRCQRIQETNNERKFVFPLIEKDFKKVDCLGLIDKVGLKLPEMYLLGYQNNNCIGCVKGQAGYWNKIRVDFPLVFEKRSKQEIELDSAINKRYENITMESAKEELPKENYLEMLDSDDKKTVYKKESFQIIKDMVKVRRRVFLFDLDPNAGVYNNEPDIQCGIFCQIEAQDLEND